MPRVYNHNALRHFIAQLHVLHRFFRARKKPLIRNFIVSGNGILGKLTEKFGYKSAAIITLFTLVNILVNILANILSTIRIGVDWAVNVTTILLLLSYIYILIAKASLTSGTDLLAVTKEIFRSARGH